MTISKLRTYDLLIFGFISIVLDVVLGLTGLFGIRLFLALSYPLVFLCYVRWEKYGVFPNIAIMITHLLLYVSNISEALPHIVGLALLSVTLLFLQWKPMHYRRIPFYAIAVSFLSVYILSIFVEWAIHLLFLDTISIITVFINHVFNIGLGIGLLGIMYSQKILLVQMDRYLRETKEGNHQNYE